MNRLFIRILVIFVITGMFTLLSTEHSYAQNRRVQCGDIAEVEFDHPNEDVNLTLTLSSGDELQLYGLAVEKTLQFSIIVKAPDTHEIAWSTLAQQPSIDRFKVAYTGSYILMVSNHRTQNSKGNQGGIGKAKVSIGCIWKKNGVIILPPNLATKPAPSSPPAYGFPGLPPVDFKNAIELPLAGYPPIVAPIASDIVFVYKFSANEEEIYVVTIDRNAGEASFAMTILDPANVPVFTTVMGSMDTMSVDVKITTTGKYTLGFFLTAQTEEEAKAREGGGVFTITVNKKDRAY
ncbi:MAG: hypothetical protein KF716_06645 [Anaerolineae bacterium]|nr:hypothetical protein [Anaerolineae bacterium]